MNNLTDIELIDQYYQGKLDAKAMQELEQRALDDPFLADAMEGFEEFTVDKQAIADLQAKLRDKIAKRQRDEKSIWSIRTWAVAASLVLLIGLATVYLNQTEENKPIQVSELQIKEGIPNAELPKEPEIAAPETTLASKPALIALNKDINAPKNKTQDISSLLPVEKTVIVEDSLQQAAAPVQQGNNVAAKVSSLNEVNVQGLRSASASTTINGTVLDENGKEISGVSVIDKNTRSSVHTDSKGNFQITVGEKADLVVSFMGYQTKEIATATLKDSLKIYLKSIDRSVLADAGNKIAGPTEGWPAFYDFIKQHNKLKNRETGTVSIEFIIERDGKLSGFKVLKGAGKFADNKAIELIKSYPTWQGSLDGKPQKAVVNIRFEKK